MAALSRGRRTVSARRDEYADAGHRVVTAARVSPASHRATRVTDDELYLRGSETLLASWAQYARGSTGAALHRLSGVAAAVFPKEPERAVYNNALLDRDLGRTERAAAVDEMVAAYRSAGIDRYAAWVHESDEGMRAELSGRGYAIAESTRAMGMSLEAISLTLPGDSLTNLAAIRMIRISINTPHDDTRRLDADKLGVATRAEGLSTHQERHRDERSDTGGQECLQVCGPLRKRLDVL